MNNKLYIIRKKNQEQYWQCNSKHGAGWSPRYPKQMFNSEEMLQELQRLIEHGWFCDLTIMEL